MKKTNKKGSATVIIAIIVIILLIIGYLVMRMHWREFKARAGFTTTLIFIAVILVLLIVLYIKYRISKKKKEKEKAEQERIRQEKIAAGEDVGTLGNGKLELSDVSEAAGKAASKVRGAVKKDE